MQNNKPVLAALLKHPAAKRRIEETMAAKRSKEETMAAERSKEETMAAERERTDETKRQLSELSLEQLSDVITERLRTVPPGDQSWKEMLGQLFQESDIRGQYLQYRLSEAAAMEAAKNPEPFAVGELMAQSVRLGRKFYEALYRPECLMGAGLDWLPADCRSNAILTRFLEGNQKELALLLAAAKLRPELVPVMKAWLAEFAKKQ